MAIKSNMTRGGVLPPAAVILAISLTGDEVLKKTEGCQHGKGLFHKLRRSLKSFKFSS